MGKGPHVNGKQIDELGNYAQCTFTEDGVVYHSVEQYFQSKKCRQQHEWLTMVRLSPEECARYGRRVKLVDNWESIKRGVMERAIHLKFDQNPHLMDILRSTFPHRLYFCEGGKEQDEWDVANEAILTELRDRHN
jgi:ribA/ribD-fused uncharacterized protein